MKVRVLFFAILKEKMKRSEGEYELQAGESVSQLAHRLLAPAFGEGGYESCLMYAVGEEYVPRDYRPKDGEEIALIPPVAGG
ncbi:MAG: MoaD/ThiS family protein [bacterium]